MLRRRQRRGRVARRAKDPEPQRTRPRRAPDTVRARVCVTFAPEGSDAMATVTVNWTTKTMQVPAPTDLRFYRVAVDQDVGVQMVPLGTLEAIFDDVPAGNYVVRVALSNTDGTHLEGEQATAFVVPIPNESAEAPDVVQVAVGG